ncbi:hypothetical protein [Saccharopolyspora sp. NPDC002376]
MTATDHRAKSERLLADQYRSGQSVAEAQVHATLALVDALRQHEPAEPATPANEKPASEELSPEQIANRHRLAARLRVAREHAETVHPGQYGRSLGVLLGFLARRIEDPKRPPLGFMPRHAALVADYLAEQDSEAKRTDLCKAELNGYPFWHDEGGNTVRIAPEPDGLGVNFWVTECGNEDGPRLDWDEVRDIARYLLFLDAQHKQAQQRAAESGEAGR